MKIILVAVCACLLIGVVTAVVVRAQRRASTKTLRISDENAALLKHLSDYPNLEVLSISCVEELKALPDSIGTLHKLRELRMDNGNGCAMNPQIPDSIGNLQSLETLVLFGAQDPRDGPQPSERHFFPRSMSRLKNLKHLDLGRNGLDEIPDFVGELPKLRELGFSWNNVKQLPRFVTNLKELQTLKLNADDLTDLPDFLNDLPKLNRVTLGNNCDITQNDAKKESLVRRFPRVTIDFEDDYDCPVKVIGPRATANRSGDLGSRRAVVVAIGIPRPLRPRSGSSE